MEDKVCWKSSKSVEKRSKMKWKSSKSVVKWNKVTWNEVKYSEAQCREGVKNDTLWEKFILVVKWWEVKGWGESVIKLCVGKNTRNCIQYFLTVVLFTYCTCCILRYFVCIVVSCLVCIVVSCLVCVYCCSWLVCIAVVFLCVLL
jgi:hypothetical protein